MFKFPESKKPAESTQGNQGEQTIEHSDEQKPSESFKRSPTPHVITEQPHLTNPYNEKTPQKQSIFSTIASWIWWWICLPITITMFFAKQFVEFWLFVLSVPMKILRTVFGSKPAPADATKKHQ